MTGFSRTPEGYRRVSCPQAASRGYGDGILHGRKLRLFGEGMMETPVCIR